MIYKGVCENCNRASDQLWFTDDTGSDYAIKNVGVCPYCKGSIPKPIFNWAAVITKGLVLGVIIAIVGIWAGVLI